MKKFIPLLLAVFAIAFVSCEKDPDMDKLDLLSETVKMPNTGKTKVHRKSSAHTLLI